MTILWHVLQLDGIFKKISMNVLCIFEKFNFIRGTISDWGLSDTTFSDKCLYVKKTKREGDLGLYRVKILLFWLYFNRGLHYNIRGLLGICILNIEKIYFIYNLYIIFLGIEDSQGLAN